jgi:phosphatidylethanolamine-binding protein (PEBP) family uncharacterized protein
MSALWKVSLILVLNRLLLNREYVVINALKALASISSMCGLHVIFLSNITPRYFNIIYKWDIPPIQCKKRLRWSNSMREVDSLCLVFIDFNVPTLIPFLH